MTKFIGREREIELLNRLRKKKAASLVVVKGRRRIGKSRLIMEFAKTLNATIITGLAPEKGFTAQHQRDNFADQLEKRFSMGRIERNNWADLFWHLANQVKTGPSLILLDELSWMAHGDVTFLPKLKNAWDLNFKNNDKLILVLCSSVSSWIEDNIIKSTAFFGRISLHLHLKELPLKDCDKFWGKARQRISAYEKFKLLAVTGGIPRYLEEIDPTIHAEQMIKQLCFEKEGILFKEFDSIFSIIFGKRSATYRDIVNCLIKYPLAELDDIYHTLKISKSGKISEYLAELVEAGFVSRHHIWHIKTEKESMRSRYRISDNYLRFYLKYISPNKQKILRDAFSDIQISMMSGWKTIMGLQFENLVLNNRARLLQLLHIDPAEIVYDNPYFQKKTKKQKGVQIDYMIQTKYNCLYICEIKFYRQKIDTKVIADLEEKVKRLKVPKNYSIRTVLIHVNDVTDDVIERDFFSDIIDFGSLLS